MKQITFTGSHGTGKTTILELLKEEKKFNQFLFIEEIVRKINIEYGTPINLGSTDETQTLIFNKYLEIFIANQNKDFISDRSLIDVLAYTKYLVDQKNVAYMIYAYQKTLYSLYVKKFLKNHTIIYFPITFDLIMDKFRNESNLEYREAVDKNIVEILKEFHKDNFIIINNGLPEERIKFLIEKI